MKLKVGDIIQVHGWVMLEKLNDGEKYRVAKITKRLGDYVYWFSKPRGRKIIVGHYASDVDGSIDPKNLNRIEIIPK